MAMEDVACSAVAQALQRFAAYIGTLPPAAPRVLPSSSSSSAAPANCVVVEIHVKVRWLIRMLAWVRATLDDAEEMKTTDEPVRVWLRELEGVADAAEDVLDELRYEARRLGLMEDCGWAPGSIMGDAIGEPMFRQVHSFSSTTPPDEAFAFLCSVERRIEQIVSNFMEIEKPVKTQLLEYTNEQLHVGTTMSAGRATGFMVQEQQTFGRKRDLEEVKKFLFSYAESSGSSDTDDVAVMAIVGMGGLGKTTLAQLAYDDDEVKQYFELKSWISLSENLDIIHLTRAILHSLNPLTSGLSELDPLHRELQKALNGKSFLLVLDDAWRVEDLNSNFWRLFTAPLRDRSADTKVIITSRDRNVSDVAERVSTYDLPGLEDEDCLKLFTKHAFQGRDPQFYPNLMATGEKITRKCKGVPLVAKTLGGLLQNTDSKEWNNILDREHWNTTVQGNPIMPILELSYQHLPAHLKRCFRFFSVFPRGCSFHRDQIIRMWMAHGYVKAKRRELMEDVSNRYLDDLLSRSFLQKSKKSEGYEKFWMHDLMHDLARWVSEDECCSVEVYKSSRIIQEHTRHLSIVTHLTFSTESTLPSVLVPEPASSLRTLLAICWPFSSTEVLNGMIPRMKHLRVLDLGGRPFCGEPQFSESLGSIATLKYLRYLALEMQKIPPSISIMGVHPKLPNTISSLLNLRYLMHKGYRGNDVSVEYPVGIGRLTDLESMPGFHVNPKHDSAKLGELKELNNIKGSFAITGLHNLADVDEAKKACLDKKRNITSLCLKWDFWNKDSPSIDDQMLESLKPSPKLGSLSIWSFRGPSCPSWLGDPSFSKLRTVALRNCRNLASLPPIGQLPSLKSLHIGGPRGVEYIGDDFFFGGFPQLEELTLCSMDNWKSWCGARAHKGECPKLERLSITRCKNLESLSLTNLGAVKVLDIRFCHKLRCLSGSLQLSQLPCVQKIHIEEIYRVWRIGLDLCSSASSEPSLENPSLELHEVGQQEAVYVLGECSYIRQLLVKRCPELRISSDSLQLWKVTSLQGIVVKHTHGVAHAYGSFSPGGTETLETSFLSLVTVDLFEASALLNEFFHIRRLAICLCANLTSLPLAELHALEHLEISECPQFQLLNVEHLPPTLRVLCIQGHPCVTEQCSRHQRPRLRHVLPSEKGEDKNLYLMFRNVQDARKAATGFCCTVNPIIHTWELEWDCCANHSSSAETVAEEALDRLFADLDGCYGIHSVTKLVIRGFTGSWFPSWSETPFFDRVSSVSLLQCSNCEILPPLGQQPSLEELYVEGAARLERVGHEFFGAAGFWQRSHSFQHLKTLQFCDMPVWVVWGGTKEGDFPSLCKLTLKLCPRLRALPHLPPTLKELEVEACDELISLCNCRNPTLTSACVSYRLPTSAYMV
ncbi:hypothetical protein Taro_031286 [Colocasia esculenta]|uniref:Disease resistance RPP13-like protein 1 n=1 Tax=Colocasia esculenta TaxID=4460 RepID=A0A843VU97_COLES|nr:hypothetical protein [Colocasia esculenta]